MDDKVLAAGERGGQSKAKHLQTCQHITLDSTALPSEPNLKINKGKAVLSLPPTATCCHLPKDSLSQLQVSFPKDLSCLLI
ncbi:hypothetical protein PBY51_023572 [Eleginops maclovinus]|uniref:Uncharacterized protein n=1 Tax=Eleginops maclovinus TaxID=56733 RepID=A0AAN8AE82_ELEMC|nr:hypothetical protein PBY51_023572 [Eleginops maclovinus]